MKSYFPFGRFRSSLLTLSMVVILLTGCNFPVASTGGVSVWIDVPLDGLVFPAVQSINVEGHASSSNGIGRVEVWIDGAVLGTIDNPPAAGGLASFQLAWTPPTPGTYTIQAVAYTTDGMASQPDTARVAFGTIPTPVITETPSLVPTVTPITPVTLVAPVTPDTPIPPPPASPVVQFWADPSSISAGACTTIHWHVENVNQVIFGGIVQPFDGSYTECLCADERYSLAVTYVDGSQERFTTEIAVSGSCVTPEAPPAPTTPPPPSDTTPPPAPTPVVPSNGLAIACKASQTLAWMPVSDPGGIREYQIQVQRQPGDNNWQGVIALPGIHDKQTTINVECGWYYRWRVRAVDGAGNVGAWSGWYLFSITLG